MISFLLYALRSVKSFGPRTLVQAEPSSSTPSRRSFPLYSCRRRCVDRLDRLVGLVILAPGPDHAELSQSDPQGCEHGLVSGEEIHSRNVGELGPRTQVTNRRAKLAPSVADDIGTGSTG